MMMELRFDYLPFFQDLLQAALITRSRGLDASASPSGRMNARLRQFPQWPGHESAVKTAGVRGLASRSIL